MNVFRNYRLAALVTFLLMSSSAFGSCLDPFSWPQTVEVVQGGSATRLRLGIRISSVVEVRSATIVGNTVTVDIGFADGACSTGAPPLPVFVEFPLSTQLSPGTYQLIVLLDRIDEPDSYVANRTFVVAGGTISSAAVPALTSTGMILLLGTFLLIGLMATSRSKGP